MLLTFRSHNLESRQGGLPPSQTDTLLFHNSISFSQQGKGKQIRDTKKGNVCLCVCYSLQAFHECSAWASTRPTLAEQQEKLEATRRLRLMLHIVHLPSSLLTCTISVCVSVAFLGDIALDEEDMQMFKVDRIINLAQRTVQIINHTGNDDQKHSFKK